MGRGIHSRNRVWNWIVKKAGGPVRQPYAYLVLSPHKRDLSYRHRAPFVFTFGGYGPFCRSGINVYIFSLECKKNSSRFVEIVDVNGFAVCRVLYVSLRFRILWLLQKSLHRFHFLHIKLPVPGSRTRSFKLDPDPGGPSMSTGSYLTTFLFILLYLNIPSSSLRFFTVHLDFSFSQQLCKERTVQRVRCAVF